ncbi:calpain-like cysteine peptidase, putative [Leishmania panamensis]|uniref:Calpain-like cysteine peptidase, putative n=1 Tax=Leishmania panamensis TaxID=5679 RepID=A0A088RXG6_LEIPA|nr:calpain-like cysteine peptidase, putative [Leishmania panamensis]AIO00631.1 calpain-like cysteine peptidase, putative [Leishmania panamensis]
MPMDGSVILPTCGEDVVTDAMLDEYLQQSASPFSSSDSASEMLAAITTGSATPAQAHGLSATSLTSTLGASFLPTFKNFHSNSGCPIDLEVSSKGVRRRASHRVSTSLALQGNLSASEITSDDSGDFAFLTSDVRDADAYDLIRHYILYCKQQEKELEELEEECARLEAEQQHLYSAAIAAAMTRGISQASATNTLSPSNSNGVAATAASVSTTRGVSSLVARDEFGEAHIDPLKVCPYLNPYDAACKLQPYRYGQPTVVGCYTPVFKSGSLYRCTAADGSWLFYNDSQQYTMHVKYIVGASSVITAGPHASVHQRASGEYETQVMVWPQETEVLLVGEVNGFKNRSTAVPVDFSYTNPHATASTVSARALLNHFAYQTGKSSVSLLTTEDVLECCATQGSKWTAAVAAEGSSDGQHFVDPGFPPCSASLYRKGVDDLFLWDIPWRRPFEYLPATQRSEACLFARAVLPTDPCAGEGGDAYLCSAACSLAEYPTHVVRIFRHPVSTDAGSRERAAGAYRVTLNHGGWWTSTVVDSYLPASLKGPDLGRCSHDLRKLWYPLLEKAYAKLHGSYAAIQCGDPLEALQDLTGYPTFRFDEEWAAVAQDSTGACASKPTSYSPQSEQLFVFLEEVHQRGYLVCLSLPDDGPAESQAAQMGVVFGMSYTVLRLVRHGGSRLLQIRCPTLKMDSSGLWYAKSALWQQEPHLAALCGVDGDGRPEEASLWLDWSEALAMFEGGGVCCCRWDWAHDCRVRGSFTDGIPSFVLEVRVDDSSEDASPVEAYCILSQEDDRGIPADHPHRALRPLMLSVSSRRSENEGCDDAGSDPPADQRIRHVCSTNPDIHTEQLSFILGRDTALRVTFQPSVHPYYVIPRSLGEMNNKLFTVGLVSSTPVTTSGKLRVRLMQLLSSSPVFHNRRDFSTSQLEDVAVASFQIRGPDGRVRIGCGSTIG